MSDKCKALLATGRMSNLPTVWCNCLAAALLLAATSSQFPSLYRQFLTEHPAQFFFSYLIVGIILVTSSSLLYVGGCFLGDAIDANFDKTHKPKRPIPSGLLCKKSILTSAVIMLILGTLIPLLLLFFQPPFVPKTVSTSNFSLAPYLAIPFLTLTITLYSILHKKIPALGLPLIGLCRFFLIIAAAGISSWLLLHFQAKLIITPYFTLPTILYASAVCMYTIAFASVARTESSDSPITWRYLLRYTMLALPFLSLITFPAFHIQTLIAFILYTIWLTYAFSFLSKNKGNYVSKCLAGFCLLDACFIAHLGWNWLIACVILFILSLRLQKSAPAT